jgi:single-stranded-DNA-specific exonuclease
LKLLGARHVRYIVPDRIVDGYGLTAPIAQRVKDSGADILITVDNGIASMEGVAHARAMGLQVLVTDHHLPAAELPDADVIVNPNQPGCDFASKSIAGVGVMFYVLQPRNPNWTLCCHWWPWVRWPMWCGWTPTTGALSLKG